MLVAPCRVRRNPQALYRIKIGITVIASAAKQSSYIGALPAGGKIASLRSQRR